MREPYLAARLQGFGTTIFARMTALAVEHGAVNLGQGFPDDDPPKVVTDAAMQAIRDGHNQYAPGIGVPVLREAIAEHQQRFHGLTFDPDTEITTTVGATEAVAAAILSLCEVGDEVVVFEPTYDSYLANIAMAGAVPRPVTLRAPHLALDVDALDRAITPRTKLVLLNSPHNPSGKVFSDAELAAIAQRCVEHDLVAVTDEVYEHLVFDGHHRSLASLPDMRDRTIVISSAAKTFSVTGWKIGWACASPALSAALRTAKQFLTFTNGTPFQHAVAVGLALEDRFFADLRETYQSRRDRLCDGLAAIGFDVHRPAGTYFVTVDVRDVGVKDGLAFCERLPLEVGVAAVPEVVFFQGDVDHGRPLVRFAFCKSDAVLDEGIERLQALDPRRLPA